MKTECIGGYELWEVMLDLGENVNILLNQSWEFMGRPYLVSSPIQLQLVNQLHIFPIGRLEHMEVYLDGVKTYTDF